MKVTVTKRDLDRAIEARNTHQRLSRSCVMAQAYKRTLKGTDVAVAGGFVRVYDSEGRLLRDFKTSQQGDRLMSLFDNHKYAELRKQLPVVVTITPERRAKAD